MNRFDREHIRRMAGYQRRIDAIYNNAVQEAARLGSGLIVPDNGILSFDRLPRVKAEVDALLRDLHSGITKTITDGITEEWELSIAKNDALASSVLPEGFRPPRYFRTNYEARDAFLARKENGLNLSDRVWKYTNAFKEEIEMGLDCGIREGLDAAAMARQLKQYLQYPDKLFRRVRDEHGNLRLSRAASEFHPGRGVYRSSYKNARRLAVTETNIAYNTADHIRWQQLDFVVGIEIHLSNNHTTMNRKGELEPLVDICDELQGEYPKEFKFTGWHPHCRCIATAITKTEEEVDADVDKILAGESTDTNSENEIRELPDNFREWLDENQERIERAQSMPYFLRDNDALITKVESEGESEKTDNLGFMITEAKNMGIEYREVGVRSDVSSDAIIADIAGGDMTEGSCSSLAYCYAGNRAGYEVYDFRGGDSRILMSRRVRTHRMAEELGCPIITSKNHVKASNELLKTMEIGKEYILHTGSHAAVVRRVELEDGRVINQYLELQSSKSNGWKQLTDYSLEARFGASQRKFERPNYLIDIEKLDNDKNFRELLGYINTDKSKQNRGSSGSEK